MPFSLDPEHWTIRGDPIAHKLGEPYSYSTQGQVQRDRTLYLYNVVGELPMKEALEIIETLRALAQVYHWKEIQWERYRENGIIHTAKIPIIPARRHVNGNDLTKKDPTQWTGNST